MTTTWEVTAVARLLAALQGDARLATYVDVVEVWYEDDPTWLPTGMQRHGIALIPQSVRTSPMVTEANVETLDVRLRLFVLNWDPTDRSAIMTADDNSGGVGASSVGILQFVADVRNALRKNTMSDLLEETAMEADAEGEMATRVSEDRAHVYKETRLLWRGEYIAEHVRS